MHLPAYLVFCVFSGILALIRMYMTHSTSLGGLVWNLILALLPYLFALAYVQTRGIKRGISLFFWLFFLPNSFYILTDFVHLPEHPDMVYFDTVYITSMAFAGMISGYASLDLVHREWNIHYHKRVGWILTVLVITVSMVGVYLGRFLRFNSWDILHDPLSLLRESYDLIISNGSVWSISDPTRATESQLFTTGAMGLWQFILLYGTFFLLVYVYLYHVKKR